MASVSVYRSSDKYTLVPRLSPSPPRTLGNCLCLPLNSAVIMIIIVSRSQIQMARAKLEQGTCQSKPLVLTPLFCVKIAPSLPHWSYPPPPRQGLIHPPTVREVPAAINCTNQGTPHWPGAGLRPGPDENLVALF